MQAIDDILEVLRNGQWHELKEVSTRTRLQDLKVELITHFLAEYDFLKVDLKNRRVRLSPQLRQFLQRIEDIEDEHGTRQKKGLMKHSSSLDISHLFGITF